MSAGTSGLAHRYAKALFELADDAGASEPVGESLTRFAEAWDSSEPLREAFSSPDLSASQRRKVVEELGQRMFLESLVIKTLCLLSDRRRLSLCVPLKDAFFRLSDEKLGLVHAEVTSASRLSEAYVEELQSTLSAVTGRQVLVTRTVDPSLLGGVVTRVGDKVFDGSLKSRLEELEEELLLA